MRKITIDSPIHLRAAKRELHRGWLSIWRLLVTCIIAPFITITSLAQVTNVDGPQASPIPGVGHDYIHGLEETVNPANGSLSLRIDLGAPTSRGFSVPLALLYSSSGIDKLSANFQGGANNWSADDYLGWSYSLPTLTAVTTEYEWTDGGATGTPQQYGCTLTTSYVFQDPSGARHMMPIAVAYTGDMLGQPSCAGNPYVPSESYLSGGDDFYYAKTTQTSSPDAPITITGNDGTVYHFSSYSSNTGSSPGSFPDYIEDRNGNVMNGLTDTAGRPIASFSPYWTNATQINVSGISNPYHLQRGSLNTSFSFNYQYLENYPNSSCTVQPTSNGSTGTVSVVQALTLPNGQTYYFQYDSTYGLLNKITYPNGGYVQYVWEENPLSAFSFGVGYYVGGQEFTCTLRHGTPAIMHRYVSYDGVHIAEEQDFSNRLGVGNLDRVD